MKKYKVKILKKEWVADGVLAVYLKKPAGFKYIAGQYTQVWLSKDPNDSRTYSLASAPHERHLMFATRISVPSSPLKKKLVRLKEGTAVTVESVAGDFVLPKGKHSFVFLVGGMGITAARAMILAEARARSPRPIAVRHWTRVRKISPFLKELEGLGMPRYSFICYTTSQGSKKLQRFKKELKNRHGAYFFVVGPPGFVVWMTEILDHANIPPTHIKAEEFSGYLN